jgi:hypothetical protein
MERQGLCGVDATLCRITLFEALSQAKKSVNVPPTSTPIVHDIAYPAAPALQLTSDPALVVGSNQEQVKARSRHPAPPAVGVGCAPERRTTRDSRIGEAGLDDSDATVAKFALSQPYPRPARYDGAGTAG